VKVLVFGRGFIGQRIAELGYGVAASRIEDATQELDALKPDVVVNCAGRTGWPNVDACEKAAFETFWSNTHGAIALADACGKRGIHLVHMGSGCIFQGSSPTPGGWKEDDFANPGSTYACSKWAADLALRDMPNVAIVRVRMPIDGRPHQRNLINKLTTYKRVIDVENSITVVDDLMMVLRRVIELRATGVFHATNPGLITHRAILGAYQRIVDPQHVNEWIDGEDLVKLGLADRPRSNCQLSSVYLQALGIRMRPIAEALPLLMEEYAEARYAIGA